MYCSIIIFWFRIKPNCLRFHSTVKHDNSHFWVTCEHKAFLWFCAISSRRYVETEESHDYSFPPRRKQRENRQRIAKGSNGRSFRSLLSLVQRNRRDQDNRRVNIKHESCYTRFWSGRNKKGSRQTAASCIFAKRSCTSSPAAFKRHSSRNPRLVSP